MPPKKASTRIDDLLAGVTADLLEGGTPSFQHNSPRVERILLEMVRPDPVQPRRVLPEQIHVAFHSQRLTPTQALKELIYSVQVAARQRGQPFQNVIELLPNADDEREEDVETKLSPEEQLLRDLVNLAVTIRDEGQVNPLTVVDVSQGVTRLFRIETGERRYWATWLLRDFMPHYTGDGMLPCLIIPAEKASVFRQAKENTARSGLSSIAMARQAALLLLAVHEYDMPVIAVTNDFYRQALDLDLRGRREYTDAILSAMGGIDKGRFRQFKSLLQLSDEALELADRYSIEEGKLRHVIHLSAEYHAEIVRQIVDFNLTGKQVKELCEGEGLEANEEDVLEKLPAAAIKMARVMQSIHSTSAQDFAHALVQREGNAAMARARLQSLQRLIVEVERLLETE
jgi:hypothetical protein